ncbi:hypothetical protein ACFQ2B_23015 [Streptomyces stramineus]
MPLLAGVLTVALTATGCVTVHGEREILPAVDRAEAPKILKRFTDGYNEAYRKLDPNVISRVEAGPLAEIGHADMRTQNAITPGGNPKYPPLVLDDARFTVPGRPAGRSSSSPTPAATATGTAGSWSSCAAGSRSRGRPPTCRSSPPRRCPRSRRTRTATRRPSPSPRARTRSWPPPRPR